MKNNQSGLSYWDLLMILILAAMPIVLLSLHFYNFGGIIDTYKENRESLTIIIDEDLFGEKILENAKKWSLIDKNEVQDVIVDDLKYVSYFNNGVFFNGFDSVSDIQVDNENIVLTQFGVPSGYACYRMIIGPENTKSNHININKQKTNINNYNPAYWEKIEIIDDSGSIHIINTNSADIEYINKLCKSGAETYDIKYYKYLN